MKRTTPHPDFQVIDRLGGTSAVARICELSDGAISQWRTNGIPKGWRRFLKEKFPSAFQVASSQPARAHCDGGGDADLHPNVSPISTEAA